MKEIEFNLKNAVKVLKALENGLVDDCIKDGMVNKELYGMAQTATCFTGILTNEVLFRNAIDYLSDLGVIIK
mgnify:CR=1 FL=1